MTVRTTWKQSFCIISAENISRLPMKITRNMSLYRTTPKYFSHHEKIEFSITPENKGRNRLIFILTLKFPLQDQLERVTDIRFSAYTYDDSKVETTVTFPKHSVESCENVFSTF